MRILVVKLTSMGDVIHAMPAITDAKEAIPELEIDFLVDESFAEIPSWHSGISKVIPVANRRWRRSFFRSFSEIKSASVALRETHYDAIIDLQGLVKSAMTSKVAHGVIHGYDKASAREPLASTFYHQRYSVSKSLHAIDRVRSLMSQALGYESNSSPLNYGLKGYFLDQEKVTEFISPYWVFLHGTAWQNKQWPENYWVQMIEISERSGKQVYLPWGNEEEKLRADRIAKHSEMAHVLPKSTLKELAQLLIKAEGVVSVDTGLGHLSAALDKPTVVIYGPTNTQLIGTIGKNQVHLCAEEEKNTDKKQSSLKSKAPYDYTKVTGELVFTALSSMIERENV